MKRPNGVTRRQKGVALVIVLSCLILVCGLVLSFFLSVSTETKASKLVEGGGRSRDLVDTAVNVVMAQIRAATTMGTNVAWASQPGMIRTFGSTAAPSGVPLTNYKLYSASEMVWNATGTPFTPATDVPANWSQNPASFSDVNQPVRDLQGNLQYPIVDPSSLSLSDELRPKGFNITGAPVSSNAPAGVTANPAPMPVRWLYVLRDGSLSVPTGGTPASNANGDGATATWAGSANPPTSTNPIVGRIAFWTDDDSSKVNINTAGGDRWIPEDIAYAGAVSQKEAGSYWAPPHTGDAFDRQALANFPPAQLEYQRYPGHPATTYLSAVLPSLTRAQIGAIAPRMQTGGSNGGRQIPTGVVNVDDDRLYASIDELLFEPKEVVGNSRQIQAGITRQELDRSRFFLTAHSRAPEVNLFNQPRIAMWPLHRNGGAWQTAFDRLIAFCSSAGTAGKYHFTRELSTSSTNDYTTSQRNQDLYRYLQRLTEKEIPGFGGNFLAKYPQPSGGNASDRDQILTSIVDYIRTTNLYDDTLHPGQYPAAGQNKQFAGRRSSVTGTDPGFGQVAPLQMGSTNTSGFGRFYSLSEAGLVFICSADGSGVAGDTNPATQAINAAKLASNVSTNRTLNGVGTLSSNQRRVEALFMMELFCPSRGANYIRPSMQIRVTGLETLRINGQAMGFPADGKVAISLSAASMFHGRSWGGTAGFRLPLAISVGDPRRIPARGGMPADTGLNTQNVYPFVSAPVTVSSGNTMALTGGIITVKLYAGHNTAIDDSTVPMQTIQMRFPSNPSMPTPTLQSTGTATAPDGSDNNASATSTPRETWWTFSNDGVFGPGTSPGRLKQAGRNPGGGTTTPYAGAIFRSGDVVRTLAPLHGDFRLIAGRQVVPLGVFEPHPNYMTATALAHTFTETIGAIYVQGGDVAGKLLEGAAYGGNTAPDIASTDPAQTGSKAATATGDWDTGIATYTDGPYINKPDEGNGARTFVDGSAGAVPYYDRNEQSAEPGPSFFSPNRQVSSPVMFGSLPTGIQANVPWRTLLFRPHTGTAATHRGADIPRDHLLLDLFWMPVVEPYAISEPFATAGKINMNYQLMPFTYIERSTGLHALLRSERVVAIPKADANKYKGAPGSIPTTYRQMIDAKETLRQFENRFNGGADVFRSPSEICELFLVPAGMTFSESGMRTFWNTNSLTGDNLKERPYSTLYPRLTTKSNTYTVHYRVQVLQQASRSRGTSVTAWATWNEGVDPVLAEARGSSTLERYVDPQDPDLKDYADPGYQNESLDKNYRFRVLINKRFAP